MTILTHEKIQYTPIVIGGRKIMVSVKTADRIKDRRRVLREKDNRVAQELREAMMLPKNHGSNSRHASFVAEAFTTRGRDLSSDTVAKAYKTARNMGLQQEWGELCRRIDRS